MIQPDPAVVNIEDLRELYSDSTVAQVILNYFATRQRNKNETTVDRLQQALEAEGKNISRREAVDFFKRLERLGCGKFLAGRRGRKSRFQWKVPSVSVGQAARGTTATIEAIPDATQAPDTEPALAAVCLVLTHTFQLRPDYQVRIELPPDITNKEAARLAEFIRALPFERE